MNRLLLIFTLLVLFLQLNANPKKVALIIAIGDYPKELGWRKLNSANDIELMKAALLHQGFKEADIQILKDKAATQKGIVDAIENLYQHANKGSIVFFHYSGHGQQIIDEVGDEVDGLDESLIPVDAGQTFELCPAKGKNHVRDDLLGVLFTKIRRKIGSTGELIVSIDACHSGTATRGIGIARGTNIIFTPPGHKPNPKLVTGLSQSFLSATGSENLAPVVVISGSSSSELNYEYSNNGKSYGSLSFALSKALCQISNTETYRALFGKVRVLMSAIAPRQTPQLEGNVDRTVFSGRTVEQKNFTTVRLWQNSNIVVLNAGQLNGITVNSIVEFYPLGTNDRRSNLILSTGKVIETQLSESLVKLDAPLTKEEAANSWVFVKDVGYDIETLRVRISKNIPSAMGRNLIASLAKYPFVSIVDAYPTISIDIEKEIVNKLVVATKDDLVLFTETYNETKQSAQIEKLVSQIKLFVQAQLLRALESESSQLKVSFELIPVLLNENFVERDRMPLSSKINSKGQLVFNEGDFFRIKIANHGNRTAYYSLMNIQSDNAVNILIPEKDANGNPFRAPSDCKIEPGKTEELRAVFYMKEPFGQEVFKMIASNRPLQLEQLLQTKGQHADRSLLQPFEILFADSFNMLSRGNNSHRLSPEFVHIHTVVFNVAPRN